MFRSIVLLCLVQFTVGGLIRGRILLDGDANKVARVPDGSVLIIRLQDVSLLDVPAIEIARTRMSNLYAFPFGYEIQVPSEKMTSGSSYALSARLTKGETLLFINDQHIAVPTTSDSPSNIDIPVIDVNPNPSNADQEITIPEDKVQEWPEMLGQKGAYAVVYIKQKTGLTNVFTLLEGSPMTMDYRPDRVRVIVNKNGIVTQVPRTG